MQTVLIIDDEFGIVEALRALLTDEGYLTYSAADGKQGLAKLDEAKPDVILLDFMMPVIDGCGFLQALRADPAWRQVPVILMSAVPEPAVRERCGDTFSAFLHKPFNVDDLLQLLRALPGQGVARRPEAAARSKPAAVRRRGT
jgi:CheY-like chemotaxis protein